MALRTFKIKWEGQDAEIEYEDDITFGKMAQKPRFFLESNFFSLIRQ